jgi:hypothetical protein
VKCQSCINIAFWVEQELVIIIKGVKILPLLSSGSCTRVVTQLRAGLMFSSMEWCLHLPLLPAHRVLRTIYSQEWESRMQKMQVLWEDELGLILRL